jgi:hypothetical protein
VLGERSAEEIKDIGQCLVEAHRLAVEAGVQGLTLPEGGFLFLAEADVAETPSRYWALQAAASGGEKGQAAQPPPPPHLSLPPKKSFRRL